MWGVRGLLLALVLGLLSACSLPRMIDSEVESFSSMPAAAVGASYRFERLPSQQAQGAAQDQLEQMAQTALSRIGLQHNEAQAGYSVQIEAFMGQIQSPIRRPYPMGRPVILANGSVYYPQQLPVMEPTWFSHTVHVVMRDSKNAKVAFESTARFDGPWSDSANLLPAILEAALRDYPHAPPGLRKVVVELIPTSTQER